MSNKPSLHIAMPLPRRLSEYQRISGGPRSPRFHEDFDAPFSEAIVNAQTPLTPSCSDFSSSSGGSPYQERSSMDDGHSSSYTRRISPGSSLRTPSFPDQLSSPCEQQQHEFPWNVPKPMQRKATVNDRVRGWARRSLMLRSRPTSPDEQQQQQQHPTTTDRRLLRVDPTILNKITDVPK